MDLKKEYFDCLNINQNYENLSDCLKPLISNLIQKCNGSTDYSFRGPFYRLRVDPKHESIIKECDTCPPSKKQGRFGRFDSIDFPVGYFCSSENMCFWECREEIKKSGKQKVVICELNQKTENPLKLFLAYPKVGTSNNWEEDMEFFWTELIEKDTDEAYLTCRLIAAELKAQGFDGISYVSKGSKKVMKINVNHALFGYPVIDGRLTWRILKSLSVEEAKKIIELF